MTKYILIVSLSQIIHIINHENPHLNYVYCYYIYIPTAESVPPASVWSDGRIFDYGRGRAMGTNYQIDSSSV